MKKGNWIPIDKRLVKLLPTNRSYTEIEALFSLSADIDNGAGHTVKGYAALWRWSRSKVRRFTRTLEAGQDYLTDTRDFSPILRRDTVTPVKTPHRTLSRHPIRLIFNNLHSDNDPCRDTHKDTHATPTIDPEPSNPNPKEKNKGHKPENVYDLPLSFLQYIERNKPENLEAVKAIAYFLDRYQQNIKDEHPYLKPGQWEGVVESVLSLWKEYGADEDLEFEEIKILVDKYFETKFQDGCNYSILHFNSGRVKELRFYEELY